MAAAASIIDTSAATLESALLELFAPARPGGADVRGGGTASIWREDAIHRAKNLAQLTNSLANLLTRPSNRWAAAEVAQPARALARIYAELGWMARARCRCLACRCCAMSRWD